MDDKIKKASHDALADVLDKLSAGNPDILTRIAVVIDLREGSRSGPVVTASTSIRAIYSV